MLHAPSIGEQELQQIGFSLADCDKVRYRVPAIPRHPVRFDDEWHTLVAI